MARLCARPRAARGAEGHAAAPDRRLDLGRPDDGDRGQFVLDHEIRMVGRSARSIACDFTLVMLPLAVAARAQSSGAAAPQGDDRDFLSALIIAGAFTFVPGRIMNAVAFVP